MISVLICGSLVYETLMVIDDKFKHCFFPKGSHHHDVYFLVPDLRRQFGGSAGNISYNLKMLGAEPLPMASVGSIDFGAYAQWLESQKIRCDYIKKVEHTYTAHHFVTIDMDDNRMSAFHPGAVNLSHYHRIPEVSGVGIGTLSSDSKEGMMIHALEFVEAGIPFIFDPGVNIVQFESDDVLKLIEQASWILVNQQEWQIIEQLIHLSPAQVVQHVQALIITLGSQGAVVYTQEATYPIPAAHARVVHDHSGCGDAFCAGILYGLLRDIDWETTGRIATLMGAIKIERHGTQKHTINLDEFKIRFKKNFGYTLMI